VRIALLDNSTERWTASVSFTRMLALSLHQACAGSEDELGFLTKGDGLRGVDIPVWRFQKPDYRPGEVTFRKILGLPRKTELEKSIGVHRIDVVLPLLDIKQPLPNVATVGWIPDFQAMHLPQFFGAEEREHHAAMVRRLTQHATRLLLSSRDAWNHLAAAAPGAEARACPIPFPSLFAFENPPASPGDAVVRYGLPPKFAMVANQFWKHKNHSVVIAALKGLRERGIEIPLVCTGLPLDHRDSANRPLSDLLQSIASSGLHESVHVLGAVPFPDLIDLMRSAALIIQPSRFEGWSTVVQDALALGRPVLCSSLPVHREQAPSALGFFGVDAPEELSEFLALHWPSLSPGPDLAAESTALAREAHFAKAHGKQLLELCHQAGAR
jgi:glycosyltransferase involved in cell wall biosynthesis